MTASFLPEYSPPLLHHTPKSLTDHRCPRSSKTTEKVIRSSLNSCTSVIRCRGLESSRRRHRDLYSLLLTLCLFYVSTLLTEHFCYTLGPPTTPTLCVSVVRIENTVTHLVRERDFEGVPSNTPKSLEKTCWCTILFVSLCRQELRLERCACIRSSVPPFLIYWKGGPPLRKGENRTR